MVRDKLYLLLASLTALTAFANDGLTSNNCYEVDASSELKGNYSPENIMVPSLNKAWCEGVDGNGIGEWIEVSLPKSSDKVSRIEIVPGYVKSDKLFAANGRPKEMELLINDAYKMNVELTDAAKSQVFDLPKIDSEIRKVRMTIRSVYPGSKYTDTCLTEVAFLPTEGWWKTASDVQISNEGAAISSVRKAAYEGDLGSIERLVRLSNGAYSHTAEGSEYLGGIYLDIFISHPYELLFVAFKQSDDIKNRVIDSIKNPISDKYSSKQIQDALDKAVAGGIPEASVGVLR